MRLALEAGACFLGGSVALASVLEPVAHLCRGQSCENSELALLLRRRVVVAMVPLAQLVARLLLEAVRRFLAVPNGARQREAAPDAVLADRAQRLSAELLGLDVVRLQPQVLQLRVRARVEVVRLEQLVQAYVVAAGQCR